MHMNGKLFLALVIGVLFFGGMACTAETTDTMVIFETSLGNIRIELFPADAPQSVENFLQYVESGFYDGTIFHRVIPNFVVQGGGFAPGLQQKETEAPIENEAANGLNNDRATLSMARTNEVNSATSQFFINLADNDFLNHRDTSSQGYGYAVFAKVVEGMDVVDAMAQQPTGSVGPFQDVPQEDIVIVKAYTE